MATKEYYTLYRNEHKYRLQQTRRRNYYKHTHDIPSLSVKRLKKIAHFTELDELLLTAYLSRIDVKATIRSIGSRDLVIKEYLQRKINKQKENN